MPGVPREQMILPFLIFVIIPPNYKCFFPHLVSLTYAGQTLLGYAERLIDLSDEAFSGVSGEAPRGTITLGIAESLAIIRLSKVFGIYHQMLPNVDFDLKFGPCSEFKGLIRKISLTLLLCTTKKQQNRI
ncbi:MAG: hypothetical protein AB9907_10590 [Flexilinea sp.]